MMEKLIEKIKKAWAFLAYILTLKIDISRPCYRTYYESHNSSDFDNDSFDFLKYYYYYYDYYYYSDYHDDILYSSDSSDYSFHSDSSYRYDD
jgi:hypothetical protein